MNTSTNSTCDFCLEAPSKYKCPKCSHNYCSTKCYQSEKHIKCSENFYKDCCLESLKSQSKLDNPNKMKSILNRHKLESELELGNDEQERHIDEAFPNLNLDFEGKRIWDELDYEEKLEFLHLQSTNSLSSLIDVWKPWWMEVLPERIEDETVLNSLLEKLPKLHDTPAMNDSTMGKLSHCLVFNLVNIIYGYAYISRLFNGDWKDLLFDSVHGFICISSSLQDAVFTDVSTALQHCLAAFLPGNPAHSYYVSQKFSIVVIQDVNRIFNGPNCFRQKLYLEAALSDCIDIFKRFRKMSRRDESVQHENLKKISFKICKKLEFILCWVRSKRNLNDVCGEIDHEFHSNLKHIDTVIKCGDLMKDSIKESSKKSKEKLLIELL